MTVTETGGSERANFRLLTGVSIAASAAVAVAIQWLAFSEHGLNVSPDAGCYLYAARSLSRGSGFVGPDGSHLLDFPPGYPAALFAISNVLGCPIILAARLICALGAAVTVGCVGMIVARCVPRDHWWVASLAAMTVAVGPPILLIGDYAESESLFFALVMPVVVILVRLDRPSFIASVAIGVLLSVAATVRTAGVLVSIAVVIVYIIRRQFAKGLMVFVLSFVGPGLWAVHNKITTGAATIERGRADTAPVRILAITIRSVAGWFSPTMSYVGAIFGLVVVASVLVAIEVTRHNWQRSAALPVLVVMCGTLILTVAVGMVVAMDSSSSRMLAPAYPLLVITMFVSYAFISRRYARLYLIVICLGSIAGLAQTMQYAHREHFEALDPELVAAACKLPGEKVFSNDAPQLAWLCDRPVSWSPRAHIYASAQTVDELTPLRNSNSCWQIVWFNREGTRGFLIPPKDLAPYVNPVATQVYPHGQILFARCG